MKPPESARVFIPAILAAAAVMMLTGFAAFLLLRGGLERSTPVLEASTRAGAETVGRAVAGQLAHALDIGIPLDRLEGVEPYLQRIVSGSPQVKALALIDGKGRTLHATADHVEGLRVPIAAAGTSATLVVATESSLIDSAVKQLEIVLAIATVLTGVIAGGLAAGFFTFSQNPARRRFEYALNRIAEGDFAVNLAGEGRGRLSEANHALALAIEKIERARLGLAEAIATIRAIDFDGSLGRRVDAILDAAENRYILPANFEESDRPLDRSSSEGGLIWRLAVVLGLYAAVFPLVANFAIDREPSDLARTWWPVLPLIAELAAIVLGAVFGTSRGGRSRTVRAAAAVILATCVAATYWDRSYEGFILLRAGAGLAAGVMAAGLLAGSGLSFDRRDVFATLIFSMLIAGPLAGALSTEAAGRRVAFLVLGAAMIVMTPFLAAGGDIIGKMEKRPPRTAVRPFLSDLVITFAVMPASALVLVVIPAGFGYDNYLAGAGMVALVGFGAIAAPPLSPLVPAAGLIAAALLLYAAPEATAGLSFAALAAGFMAGAALKAKHGSAARRWIAIACGAGVALIAIALDGYFQLPLALQFTVVALLMMGVHLIQRRQFAGQPA